ncbi:MAG: type II secretion system minor pseudopilin GspI [Methyloprofundus sp.]|nr:type II secretion system minor pseudopilin GspI [Methyloprofundus sp.]
MNIKNSGFTLIEVMVALAVVAIGLLATLNAANQETRSAIMSQDKMTAFWLMKNKITEIRINEPWPATRQKKGSVKILEQKWYWQSTGKKTANPMIRKVKISFAQTIANAKTDPVLEQTIYLGKPE